MTTPMLQVKDLNVFYGNIHAIKGVSLEVYEGEIISLIGANGAGKTTILQTISGIIRAKSGHIYYNGVDITKTRAHKILRMGIAQVPEGRQIFSNLTVLDNLELGEFSIKASQEDKKAEMERFFERFPRMKERANQLAGTLSGGEQQMLAMGRAIASRPKLMILDEPSMGLSPIFVKQIFSTIKTLSEEGVTILLVEQNAMMALGISDRAYVLETGKIVMEGSSKELANNESVKKAYLGA
ncbi:MAG: ABC transporter ATP-binding protein [Tissierellia bacterium]|nr:ABC transporter ATP-binding protein [Tissierellia bacterium]